MIKLGGDEPAVLIGIAVAALVVLGLLVGGAYLVWREYRQQHDYQQVEGEILHAEIGVGQIQQAHVQQQSYTKHLQYRYTVAGKEYVGERIKLLGTQSSTSREGIEKLLARYPAGTKVPVHYDPLDPSRAVLETGYSWGSILFLALGLCGAAIFVLVLLRRQS
jgi:hypothetical protein